MTPSGKLQDVPAPERSDDDRPRDLTIDRARGELAALGSIVDVFEPLTPEQRRGALAAVLCMQYVECFRAKTTGEARKMVRESLRRYGPDALRQIRNGSVGTSHSPLAHESESGRFGV